MNEIIKVLASDGFALCASHFIPRNSNGKAILINAAVGVKQSYYKDFATYLASQGFDVYTFDYRGIGASRPADLRSIQTDMKDWALLDIDSMISYIVSAHPSHRFIIIGHSLGGQLIGVSKLAGKADAFMMIGSQTPYWKNYEGLTLKMKLLFFWYVTIPLLTQLQGYFPASKLGLFADLPAQVAKQWARWAKSPNYMFDESPSLKTGFESLSQPALMISFTDDHLAPKKSVLHLQKFYTHLKIEHWHFHPEDVMQKKVGHFGFFKKAVASALWRETVSWINHTLNRQKNEAA